jgi:hypothetical protein
MASIVIRIRALDAGGNMNWIKLAFAIASVSWWTWFVGGHIIDKQADQPFENRYYQVQFGGF